MKKVLIIAVALAAAAWASPPKYEYAGKWGSRGNGNGQFNRPNSVAVAPGGRVYVDDANDRLQYFTATGIYRGEFSGWTERYTTEGLEVAPTRNVYVGVSDFYDARNRIEYYTPTGSFLGSWGEWGSGVSQFRNHIRGLAVASNRRIYATDNGNNRVQYFTFSGSFLGSWGTPGSGNGEFDGPWGIAVAPGGNV